MEAEWQQVPKTLQSSLADFSSDVVWTVSLLPWMSSSPIFFSTFLEIILNTLIMIGITATFIFHNLLTLLQDPNISQIFPLFYVKSVTY